MFGNVLELSFVQLTKFLNSFISVFTKIYRERYKEYKKFQINKNDTFHRNKIQQRQLNY